MRGGEERLGRFSYRWTEACFPLGVDSLALGEFCTLRRGDTVLDLGCGAGLLLLLCARREEGLRLTGVEIDTAAAEAAQSNLTDNALEGCILAGDLRGMLLPKGVDLVVSNPPWYPVGAGKPGGPGRTEAGCTLPELCRAAAGALREKGRFALAHRPERLTEMLSAMHEFGVEPKRLRFCRHAPDRPPYAVLAEGAKGGRPGLTILPDLI